MNQRTQTYFTLILNFRMYISSKASSLLSHFVPGADIRSWTMHRGWLVPVCSIWGLGIMLISCQTSPNHTRFELLSSETTGIDFNNQLDLSDSFNILEFDYLYNGGGVAVADFNNDGLPDLFFTGNHVSCRLYLNKGQMKFEDVTGSANLTTQQWSEGVTIVDINQDDLPDIYVSTSSGGTGRPNQNLLFVNQGLNNNGIPQFSEKAGEYSIADTGYNTQAAFFDYDLDGDLDLYVLSNALETFNRNTTRPKRLDGSGKSTDKLYRNNGNGSFTNVSREAGILTEGYGLGIVITDINKDNWPDVYLSNDFVTNDILYINNGDGTFTNQISEQMRHQSHNGMGADAADYNNDGFTDIVVMDMMPETNLRQKSMMVPFANYDRFSLNLQMGYQPQYVRNTLQLNNGNNSFSEVGQLANIYQTDWSWAPILADLDNDGFKDLYITNGYGKDITDMDYVSYSQSLRSFGTEEAKRKSLLEEINNLVEIRIPNYVYRNNGNLTFADKTTEWGLAQPSISNGTAYADLDNDGDLDLIVNNLNEPAFIYRNNTIAQGAVDSTSNYLKINLKGPDQNKQGLGTKLTLFYQKEDKPARQYYEHFPTRGYKSSVDPIIHFGLQSVTLIDSIQVVWPGGVAQVLRDVPTSQTLMVVYAEPLPPAKSVNPKTKPLFREITDSLKLHYAHKAEDFVDFKIQPLLPRKHSENGPGLAIGDINGDGLEDFYVGGSPGYPGKFFTQTPTGTFTPYALEDQSVSDDMGVLLFDADLDLDLDLYVVSGGSRFPNESPEYQDRFYRNDGTGKFEQDPAAIPKMTTSGSVVTAADFDKDGDLDLFIGGRVKPHEYPLPAKSFVLQNNGGSFTDITQSVCPEFEKLGMVTAALWTDFDMDGHIDLVLTGEWMPVTLYRQVKDQNGIHFENVTKSAGLSHTSGWWNSIQGADFDKDGDIDYVAGNLGLNSRYKASKENPITIYTKDFDNNGEIDPIMFYYNQGNNYPAHSRGLLINQIAAMRGRFPKYETLGHTTFDNFFREGELEDTYSLKANVLETSYIENLGDGTFKISSLPVEAQVSPVCGMVVRDFNEDGNIDLLLVGNAYDTELVTGRYDASYGCYLEGDGKGHFTYVPARKSGFFVNGNAKALTELVDSEGNLIYLTSLNQGKLHAIKRLNNDGPPKTIPVGPKAQKAIITLQNGEKYLQEFYYGSSYLSQSSRVLELSRDAVAVTIIDYDGTEHVKKLNDFPKELAMREASY